MKSWYLEECDQETMKSEKHIMWKTVDTIISEKFRSTEDPNAVCSNASQHLKGRETSNKLTECCSQG